MLKSLCRVKIYGVNISKLYKILKTNNIEMKDILRQDYKTIFFTIKAGKLKKLFAVLKNLCYTITVVEYYGLAKLIQFFKKRFGYIIGTAIFIVVICFSNVFVSDIKIFGTKNIDPIDIMLLLNKSGIKKGTFLNKFSTEDISSLLSSQFEDISLVSVIKKGTTVIVNIKEKQTINDSIDIQSKDIIANKSGTILDIEVIQGTANFSEGDSFKAGDVLVKGGFYDIYNNFVECKAQANIKVKFNYEVEEAFLKEQEVVTRTGKIVKNSCLSIFGLDFLKSGKPVNFDSYEQEFTESYMFNNNFIPIKLKTTTFYETKKELIYQDFEENKAKIIKKLKQNARKLVQDESSITNQYEEIIKIDNGYKVKYVIEVIENI